MTLVDNFYFYFFKFYNLFLNIGYKKILFVIAVMIFVYFVLILGKQLDSFFGINNKKRIK